MAPCLCCGGISPAAGTLAATVALLLVSARYMRSRWGRRLTYMLTGASLCLALALSALAANKSVQLRLYTKILISALKDNSLDEARCQDLGLAKVSGEVLEYGPGPGTNFRCFTNHIHRWVGVEPNELFSTIQSEEAARYNLTFPRETVFPAMGDHFDAVVITHVLCSVDDPKELLADAAAALKPSGTLHVMEHVIAPRGTPMRLAQLLLGPFFTVFGNGCKFKDPEPMLRDLPNLTLLKFARFHAKDIRIPMLGPHLLAVASRQS